MYAATGTTRIRPDPLRASVRVWLRETSASGTRVRMVLAYVYWFSVLSGSVSTDQQEKQRKTDKGLYRVERIMTKRLPTRFD